MSKEKVIYKVVTKNRYSCSMFLGCIYSILYSKNKVVEAVRRSIGIMCFETEEYAKKFIEWQVVLEKSQLVIIKVKPIGKAIYPSFISSNIS